MEQAERELARPNGPGAAPAMRRASEQLKRAAGKFGDSHSPSTGAASPNSLPSQSAVPGDVKSKITRELRAKYGEDYARLIQLYFDQLAERP